MRPEDKQNDELVEVFMQLNAEDQVKFIEELLPNVPLETLEITEKIWHAYNKIKADIHGNDSLVIRAAVMQGRASLDSENLEAILAAIAKHVQNLFAKTIEKIRSEAGQEEEISLIDFCCSKRWYEWLTDSTAHVAEISKLSGQSERIVFFVLINSSYDSTLRNCFIALSGKLALMRAVKRESIIEYENKSSAGSDLLVTQLKKAYG